METVAADAVFVIVLVRECIHICILRHALMECSIEDSHLRNCRKNIRYGPDTEEVGRVVQRCDIRAFLNLCNHVLVYELAAEELFSSMNHAMAYSLDVFKS